MNKSKEKKEKLNTALVNSLAEKYGVTHNYVRMSVRGTRNGIIPIKIQEEYRALNRDVNKIINENMQEI